MSGNGGDEAANRPSSGSTSKPAVRVTLRGKNLTRLDADVVGKTPHLTALDVSNNSIEELPRDIGRLTSMSTLRAFANRLSVLPSSISHCAALTSLDLGRNEFRTLPDAVCALPALRELDMNWNRIATLPADFGRLSGLRSLVLCINRLVDLPESLSGLRSLETLDVSVNSLRSIPPAIARLPALTSLNAAANDISSIPREIAFLSNLVRLDLRSNRITSLPDSIGDLPKLSTLVLQHNRLQELPSTIGKLASLKELNVAENQLRSLPAGLCSIAGLKKLSAWQNSLDTVASEIAGLTSLTELDLTKNSIRSVHPNLGTLSSLKTVRLAANALTEPPTLPQGVSELTLAENRIAGPLSASFPSRALEMRQIALTRNGLTSVPKEIAAMAKELRILDLGFNRLAALPPEIGSLSVLMTLNIAGNVIDSLPSTLSGLKALQILLCGYNRLADIPAEVGALPALHTLHAGGNLITKVPRALCTGCVAPLKFVSLANNNIASVADMAMASLTKLEVLDLSCNQIADMTPLLSAVSPSMTDLSIAHNRLQRLPRGLAAAFPSLQDLNVARNQLQELPQEVETMRALRQLVVSGNELRLTHSGELPRYACFDVDTSSACTRLDGNSEIDRLTMEPASRPVPPLLASAVSAGTAEMCGRRPDMQDSLVAMVGFQQSPASHFIAVFDGHSGAVTAQFLSKRFHVVLASLLNREQTADAAIRQTFRIVQNEVVARELTDGSAANIVLVHGGRVLCGNCGDSRAVISQRGVAVDLSTDFKPERESEARRVKEVGGSISVNGRVNGELALTRAIGDVSMQPFVTWEPEVTARPLSGDDEFIVVACDGVWDVLTSQQVVDVARQYTDPCRAATAVRDAAYLLGSADNVSVVVLRLKQ